MSGETKFNDTRYFIYKISKSFTLVETDKPAYKPGEKGFFKMLLLDRKKIKFIKHF